MLDKKEDASGRNNLLDERVPQDYLLRKMERAVDFTKIYDFVEDLYCKDNGRPSIDPVVVVMLNTRPTRNRWDIG